MRLAELRLKERLLAFWLGPTRGSAAALFRVAYGLIAVWTAIGVLLNVTRYYTDDGLLPWASARAIEDQRFSLFALAPHDAALPWILGTVFLLAAIGLTLGCWPRIFAIVIFVINVSLQHRNPLVCNAGDRLFLMFALLAACMPLGQRWSIDELRRTRRGLPSAAGIVWGQRLIALHVAYVYLFAYSSKINKPAWINGTAIGDVLSSPVLSRWSVSIDFDALVRVLTWSTLLFELSFPLLVWSRAARPYVLAAGLLFHLGIELTLAIPIFSAIMIASYACFLSDDEAEWLVKAISARRLPIPSKSAAPAQAGARNRSRLSR